MAKKKHRKLSFKIPLAATAGLISPFISKAPSGHTIIERLYGGDVEGALYDFKEKFSGIDANGQWHPNWVVETYLPMAVGAMISKFVGGRPLNLNRMIRQIPFIKI